MFRMISGSVRPSVRAGCFARLPVSEQPGPGGLVQAGDLGGASQPQGGHRLDEDGVADRRVAFRDGLRHDAGLLREGYGPVVGSEQPLARPQGPA